MLYNLFVYRVSFLSIRLFRFVWRATVNEMISVVQRFEPRNSSDLQESQRGRFRHGHSAVADQFRNRRIAVRTVPVRSGIRQVRFLLSKYVPGVFVCTTATATLSCIASVGIANTSMRPTTKACRPSVIIIGSNRLWKNGWIWPNWKSSNVWKNRWNWAPSVRAIRSSNIRRPATTWSLRCLTYAKLINARFTNRTSCIISYFVHADEGILETSRLAGLNTVV